MKKVLVAGGSGFLGKHLIRELKNQQVEIFAIRNKNPVEGVSSDHLIEGGIQSIDSKLVDDLSPDVIFHLARPVMPGFRKWGRKLAAGKAARLNRKLLQQLNHSSHKPLLVFASGSLMYGNSPDPHLEDSPLNPVSFARQYFRGELPIVEAVRNGDYPVQVFRLPWLLGDGSWFGWFYLENIRKIKSIPKFEAGQNMMEIIDVRDAVKLMVKIAFEEKPGRMINIPSKGAISHKNFVDRVSAYFDAKVVDYRQLYPGKIEKEALEAFTSNIVLGTKYPELFKGFVYKDLEESLRSF